MLFRLIGRISSANQVKENLDLSTRGEATAKLLEKTNPAQAPNAAVRAHAPTGTDPEPWSVRRAETTMSDPIGSIALHNLQEIGNGPRSVSVDVGKATVRRLAARSIDSGRPPLRPAHHHHARLRYAALHPGDCRMNSV